MRVAGAGWVGSDAYGTVAKKMRLPLSKPRHLHRTLAEQGILPGSLEKAGRFNPSTRRAFCAAALALYDAGFSGAEDPVALIGSGAEESTAANWKYFSDFAEYGRQLGRANLFIYTLPTSPLAEIAIHFNLSGPLFYTQTLNAPSTHLLRTADRLAGQGDAAAVLAVWMENDFSAAIFLKEEGAGGCASSKLSYAESPEQWIHFLEENI